MSFLDDSPIESLLSHENLIQTLCAIGTELLRFIPAVTNAVFENEPYSMMPTASAPQPSSSQDGQESASSTNTNVNSDEELASGVPSERALLAQAFMGLNDSLARLASTIESVHMSSPSNRIEQAVEKVEMSNLNREEKNHIFCQLCRHPHLANVIVILNDTRLEGVLAVLVKKGKGV